MKRLGLADGDLAEIDGNPRIDSRADGSDAHRLAESFAQLLFQLRSDEVRCEHALGEEVDAAEENDAEGDKDNNCPLHRRILRRRDREHPREGGRVDVRAGEHDPDFAAAHAVTLLQQRRE